MAPEIIEKRKYDYLVDLFSIGIILYVLASGGKHPIYRKKMSNDEYIKELYALKSNNENFDFPYYMPLLARNLFLKLCKFEPFFRYSTFKALKHPWITRSEKGEIPLTLVDEYEKNDKIKQFKALLTVPLLFEPFKFLFHLKMKDKKDDSEIILKLLNNDNNNNEHKKITSSRIPGKNINFVFQPNNQTKQNYTNYKKNTPNLNKNKNEKKNQDYENESSNETSHISNPSQNKPKIFLKTHSNINSNIINNNNILQNSNSKRKINYQSKQKRNNASKLRELSNYKTNQINDRVSFDNKVTITPVNKSVGKIKINKGSEQSKSSKKIQFKAQDNNH